MAQMNGFADYAGEQLVDATRGPRQEALGKVQLHSDGYVRERGAFFFGAHQLMTDGHTEMAQQLLH